MCSALLLAIALRGAHTVYPIYIVIGLVGVARAFTGPASRAILPLIVPEEHFESAFAWGATFFEIATILGPAVGGLVYTIFRGPAAVYAFATACGIIGATAMSRVKLAPRKRQLEILDWKTIFAGLHYIWREKIVLGSISLDLFAVLLGGAVALLPAYAHDILHTGPWGLGLLRCAPGVGAGLMALVLAHRPLGKRAGMKMLWCVAGFGVCTILFGVSHSLALSLAALVFVGATDMVSVVVRGILIQLRTPDEMRGRVNAVDMVFIGASNDLGGFESGLDRVGVRHRARRRARRRRDAHRHRAVGVDVPRPAQRRRARHAHPQKLIRGLLLLLDHRAVVHRGRAPRLDVRAAAHPRLHRRIVEVVRVDRVDRARVIELLV